MRVSKSIEDVQHDLRFISLINGFTRGSDYSGSDPFSEYASTIAEGMRPDIDVIEDGQHGKLP